MVSPAAGQRFIHSEQEKRASDSFRVIGRRAALPQNSTPRNSSPALILVNGTPDLK
jgi:hypothetical protein